MGFPRPSLRELVTRVQGDLSSRTKGSAFIKRSVERVLAALVAQVANGLHGHMEWLQRQHLPTTADIASLLEWGVWLQVDRKGVAAASGTVFGTGTPGSSVGTGTQLQSADGNLFTATSYAFVDAFGNYSITVEANASGSTGNLDPGAPLSFVSPASGIDATVTVDQFGVTGGIDVEDVEDYRDRILRALRKPPAGGGPGDYETWALEVPGVTRAWEFGAQMGYGTVSVGFVMDARTIIIPLDADVATVQAYIDARRPLDMRAVYVQAPILVPVNMTVSIATGVSGVNTAVLASLKDLFIREPDLGKTMSVSKVDEAISTTVGEDSHTITSISSLNPGAWGILSLGTVTFA